MVTPRCSLPMYFPPSFNLAGAMICAALVNTAYDQFAQWQQQGFPMPPAPFNWAPNGPAMYYSAPFWATCTVLGNPYPEPFGFLCWTNGGDGYLVFRGSVTKADFYEDAWINQKPYPFAPNFGYVHAGFLDIVQTPGFIDSILGWLAAVSPLINRLYVSGHSLGCGLSSLMVPVLFNSLWPSIQIYHYNFASPRVGDPQFAYMSNLFNVPAFRIVNTEDIIPDAPPAVSGQALYKHLGTPVDFTAQYGTLEGNHSMLNCYTYAINNSYQPEGPIPTLVNAVIGQEVAAFPLTGVPIVRPGAPVSTN